MEVKIQTLTPLWTGGVDGSMDRIHETGIIGSMRWWYEAIVRGLGGSACDPSKGGCIFNAEKYRQSKAIDERHRLKDAGLCDVCQIFGATGWKRRFRLEIEEHAISNACNERTVEANRTYEYTDRKGLKHSKTPKWHFKSAKAGQFSIICHSLSHDFQLGIIDELLRFMIEWTALGAKTQMGFGVIESLSDPPEGHPLYNWIKGINDKSYDPDLPSIRDMFFARIQLTEAKDREIFDLKYDLRRLFAEDRNLRHFIMGTISGEHIAAKVKLSRPYEDGQIRVWGWVPREASVYSKKCNKESILQSIYGHINSQYSIKSWHEMNSTRDKIYKNQDDPLIFLKSLLIDADDE